MPCLGFKSIDHRQLAKYDKFIDRLVDQGLELHASNVSQKDGMFKGLLYELLIGLFNNLRKEMDDALASTEIRHQQVSPDRVQPKPTNPRKITLYRALRNVHRMVMIQISARFSFCIIEAHRERVLASIVDRYDIQEYGFDVIPRVANLQIKHYLHQLQVVTLKRILTDLHAIFRDSRATSHTWLTIFILLLGLGITLEDSQRSRRLSGEDRRSTGVPGAVESTMQECGLIDKQYQFLIDIFHAKLSKRGRARANIDDYISTRPEGSAERTFVELLKILVSNHGQCSEA